MPAVALLGEVVHIELARPRQSYQAPSARRRDDYCEPELPRLGRRRPTPPRQPHDEQRPNFHAEEKGCDHRPPRSPWADNRRARRAAKPLRGSAGCGSPPTQHLKWPTTAGRVMGGRPPSPWAVRRKPAKQLKRRKHTSQSARKPTCERARRACQCAYRRWRGRATSIEPPEISETAEVQRPCTDRCVLYNTFTTQNMQTCFTPSRSCPMHAKSRAMCGWN